METPEVARCPDGHFRWIMWGFGPYLADYMESAVNMHCAGVVGYFLPFGVVLTYYFILAVEPLLKTSMAKSPIDPVPGKLQKLLSNPLMFLTYGMIIALSQ